MLKAANKTMTAEEVDELLKEAFDHLTEGRYRIALTRALAAFEQRPNDFRIAICLAWAYLENGDADLALEYADLAVNIGKEIPQTKLYRGFILMRLGIFDGAITDLESVIKSKSEPLSWAHHLKAKAHAGRAEYQEAYEEFELAIKADKGANKLFPKLREWYKNAAGQGTTFLSKLKKPEKPLIEEAEEAFKMKEFWYAIWAIRRILNDPNQKEYYKRAKLLELETLYALFQLRPALMKAKAIAAEYGDDERFKHIYAKLQNFEKKKQDAPIKGVTLDSILSDTQTEKSVAHETAESKEEEKTATAERNLYQPLEKQIITLKKRTDFHRYENPNVVAYYAKTFDVGAELGGGERLYLLQFAEATTRYIGVEVIVSNPYYKLKEENLPGTVAWFINNQEVGRHNFEIPTDREWKNIIFTQSWGTDTPGFWKRGQGRVELYIYDQKICERWFLVGNSSIVNSEEVDMAALENELSRKLPTQGVPPSQLNKQSPLESGEPKSVVSLLSELDKFVGLTSVKQSMRDFVDYLEFINERKKQGLKTQEGISVNSVFLGNPGTGKTSVARVLGAIFKAMGILEKGHIIEVDRGALVGQYIGETAQKTEKVIEDAMGGLLFIDEAYTLVKKGGSGQDFGQEAIDTLLKRMEDKAGQFAVIVAGYPDEMNDFLTSNPGMKSRFTHFFNFEDYNPDELIEIFRGLAKKEDFSIDEAAIELLKKEFTAIYRKRDKTFGNARFVRNVFNDAKMQLSKRYLKLPENLRDKKALTTISAEDVAPLFKKSVGDAYKVGIDEENLYKALEKINSLTGLYSVKKEVNELVKLAKFYIEQGDTVQNKFNDHVLFLGNPGTGKTTVARLLSQIYAALGIIPKGQLVEADRQMLVAPFVGKTAEKTTELINQAMGGTLFIDEAYTLVKQGDSNDFGKEAIDTLLKRMEDDRGKFIVIAAGYTENMQQFLESNPGLMSRFTKTFMFEDYTPDELLIITRSILKSRNLKLEKAAEDELRKHYMELYRTRDKNFGNARLVRNVVDAAVKNQLLRLVDLPKEERTPEITQTIILDDLKSIISTKSEKKQVQIEGNQEQLDKYLKELNELTGLDSVKRSVERLIGSLKVAKLREARGFKTVRKNLHAVFLGNPGTGKTTVARLMSKIYKELGLIDKGHLVEVDRSGLVAGYQGQTAQKTDEVIKKALGGTLFIDEAYTLARGGNDFGQEAIDTLLKRMEDYKEELIVIVAGYPEEMQMFLDANPGMQSRFTNFFDFEDYTPRQMLEIATVIAEKNGYQLDEGALQLLLEKFNYLYQNRDANFGNARTVRNILFKAISNQEERILTVLNPTDQDLITITYEDVEGIDN